MSRLKGRKALVTGAASGIGAATVARLLADGALTGSAGSCTTSGFSAGLLIKQHDSCPRRTRAFCILYLWQEIVKS